MPLIAKPTKAGWTTLSEERRQYRREYDSRHEVRARKRERQKAYYYRHRDRRLGVQRRANYACSPEAYDLMLAQQEGRCAICRRPETGRYRGRLKKLAVDHDHATGGIRGLLCGGCNIGLGAFGTEPDRLRAAIAYLLTHSVVNRSF